MARATLQNMRDFLGDSGEIPSSQLELMLETARQAVERDGIGESHDAFAWLQMLYCAHLLETAGAANGSIASRAVGDVSVSFSNSQATTFFDIYQRLKAQVIGFEGRIA